MTVREELFLVKIRPGCCWADAGFISFFDLGRLARQIRNRAISRVTLTFALHHSSADCLDELLLRDIFVSFLYTLSRLLLTSDNNDFSNIKNSVGLGGDNSRLTMASETWFIYVARMDDQNIDRRS